MNGISIVLVIHSVDRSLFIRLIVIRSLDSRLRDVVIKGWCAVRTLQFYGMGISEIGWAGDFYRPRYSLG